jgi:hypothetical protein
MTSRMGRISIHRQLASLRDQKERNDYSGSMICPLISKFALTEGTPVPG